MCMLRGRLEFFAFSISSLHILKHFGRVAVREAIVKSFGVLEMAVTAPGELFRHRNFLGHDPKALNIYNVIRTC